MLAVDKILIVEDLPEVSDWLKRCVEASFATHVVIVCAELKQAKAALKQQAFDLLLVDLGLPDGDGHELIALFKEKNPQAYCVVTTIFDDAEHLFNALRAGADGYLLKDHDEQQLIDQLSGILRGRPPLSDSIARRLLQQFHQPAAMSQTEKLTAREIEVLGLIARGLSVKESAEMLSISYYTSAGYLKNIYQKLQVNNRVEATRKAMELRLLNEE